VVADVIQPIPISFPQFLNGTRAPRGPEFEYLTVISNHAGSNDTVPPPPLDLYIGVICHRGWTSDRDPPPIETPLKAMYKSNGGGGTVSLLPAWLLITVRYSTWSLGALGSVEELGEADRNRLDDVSNHVENEILNIYKMTLFLNGIRVKCWI